MNEGIERLGGLKYSLPYGGTPSNGLHRGGI
jgi:hypothetical protein